MGVNEHIDKDKGRVQKMRIDELQVIGEQDGPPERVLKSRLIEIIRQYYEILAAYLVKVDYGKSVPQGVALCLLSEADANEQIVSQIAEVYANVFTSDVHMDIVFLRPNQESQLSSYSKSFYNRRSGR